MEDFLDNFEIRHFLLTDEVRNELAAAMAAVLADDDRTKVRGITGDSIPVDVRVYNEAPLHAQFRALTGRILVIRDADAFARVVESVVPRHLDTEPLRQSALRDLMSARDGS